LSLPAVLRTMRVYAARRYLFVVIATIGITLSFKCSRSASAAALRASDGGPCSELWNVCHDYYHLWPSAVVMFEPGAYVVKGEDVAQVGKRLVD
jgi:hypothetical protein